MADSRTSGRLLMIWSKPPVWKVGDDKENAMTFDATDSGKTGFVQITAHTSILTHRCVPLAENDFTRLCIEWLMYKDVIEVNIDPELPPGVDRQMEWEATREQPERMPEFWSTFDSQQTTEKGI